jgi:hypothetical protein
MNVFISWSGAGSKSHTLALAFHDWLPNVFQTIETFMSSDTLVAGERWQGGLSKALEECDFGIACLTPTHYHANWILFECGALAKKVDRSRVVPVLCNVTEQMMAGHPLTMFNYVNLGEEGVWRLLESINTALGKPLLPKEKLTAAFEKWWPDFEDHIKRIEAASDEDPPKKFNMESAVEEILSVVRSLSRRRQSPQWLVPPASAHPDHIDPAMGSGSVLEDWIRAGLRKSVEANLAKLEALERQQAADNLKQGTE